MTLQSALLKESFNVCGVPSNVDWYMLLVQWIFIVDLVCDSECSKCWGHGSEQERQGPCSCKACIPTL